MAEKAVVFFSYSRDDLVFCHLFAALIRDVFPGVAILRDLEDSGGSGHPYGEDWLDAISRNVNSANIFIQLLSESAGESPFVSYEAGLMQQRMASDSGVKLFPISLSNPSQLPSFFERQQALVIGFEDSSASLKGIMRDWLWSIAKQGPDSARDTFYDGLKNNDRLEKALNHFVSAFLNELAAQQEAQDSAWLATTLRTIVRRVAKEVPNGIPGRLVSQWLTQLVRRGNGALNEGSLKLPPESYPYHLVELIRSCPVAVDAVALVDDYEGFWNLHIGEEILEHSRKTSNRRIFVFKDQKALIDFYPTLMRHASEYGVGAITENRMRSLVNFVRDFSVFQSTESRSTEMAAYYADDQIAKEIIFCWEEEKAATYQRMFNRLWEEAYICNGKKRREDAIRSVFVDQRREMSEYIDIHEYHRCEEQHPYYVEMLQKMLDELVANSASDPANPSKVLEMGTGTGHLTKRLLTLEPARIGRIVGLEFDTKLTDFLLQHSPADPRLEVFNEDAREYDPAGKFDFVLSSFSDHHIIGNEKQAEKYLRNIRRNLHPSSYFICGDEFLPDHDGTVVGHKEALRKYHGHIISQARERLKAVDIPTRNTIEGLIKLEEAALSSGLLAIENPDDPKCGDYKVPLRIYLDRLRDMGFTIELIDRPAQPNDDLASEVGGVYVVVARAKAT